MPIKLPSHLHRSRSGILHFRIAIPPDVRHHFATKEIYRSMQTANVRQAANDAKSLSTAYRRIFEELRKKPMPDRNTRLSGPVNHTDCTLEFVADLDTERIRLGDHLLSLLEKGAAIDKRKAALIGALQAMQEHVVKLDALRGAAKDPDRRAAINAEYHRVDGMLDKMLPQLMAFRDDQDGLNTEYAQLLQDVRELSLSRQHQEAITEQANAHKAETHALADFVSTIVARAPASEPKPVASMPLLSATIEDFARFKRAQGKWTAKTEAENRAVYELFKLIIGDKPLADIDDDAIVGYLETLKKLPPNINSAPAYAGKSIEQIIALPPETTMAARTINKNVERVSSLFKWAMGKTKYGVTRNPAAGMSLDESGAAKRQPFTNSELAALFGSEEFMTRKFENPYAYWLMPMGLLTGARLGELCQLYLTDFVDHNGVQCIDVSDQEEGQRLKNTNAKRLVPVHSRLIELGLLRYVDHLREIGVTRLFPELNERRDGFAQAASNWFQRHKKKCGIDGKHTKVFHSFRHSFISALLDDEVPEHAVAQIVGHEANLITGQVYWNARDAAKRKPTVEKYQLPDEVWELIPKFEDVTIIPRRGPRKLFQT
jgi:integrase